MSFFIRFLIAFFFIAGSAVSAQLAPFANAKLKLLASYTRPLAHEGPVFIPELNQLFFTSNRLYRSDGSQYVVASSFNLQDGSTRDLGLSSSIPMANGAFRLSNGNIVVTMQGNKFKPAGLAEYNPFNGNVKLLTTAYAAYQFNSPNDVVQAPDSSIWFTDPQYGYEQGFRPKPAIGNWVWRYHPANGIQRLMIDGFAKPNGLAFSLDFKYLYVTDSGYISGNGARNNSLPRTVYRFMIASTPDGLFATDRSVFCVVTKGIPDGIKVDQLGRVWTGTGAGLEVFDKDGTPLAVIPVPGGVSNFALAPNGAYVMGETKLYRLDI
jgi:gluconolactonase